MLQIVETKSIAASCQVCRTIILDRLNIASNLGSGKYAYHYHIDCFKNEYGATIAKIMESQGELNPILVARAAKPKPLWRLVRNHKEYKVMGPEQYSSAWLGGVMVEGIKLDKELMTTAVLAGRLYCAQIIDHFRIKDIMTCTNPYGKGELYALTNRKITYIGTSKYTDASSVEQVKKMYLIEGIRK